MWRDGKGRGIARKCHLRALLDKCSFSGLLNGFGLIGVKTHSTNWQYFRVIIVEETIRQLSFGSDCNLLDFFSSFAQQMAGKNNHKQNHYLQQRRLLDVSLTSGTIYSTTSFTFRSIYKPFFQDPHPSYLFWTDFSSSTSLPLPLQGDGLPFILLDGVSAEKIIHLIWFLLPSTNNWEKDC